MAEWPQLAEAQIASKSKTENCFHLTEQPIKDAVITVPAFFNQAERRAVLHAAQMAGLKVLQLINDNTAVALNYGVFRRKDIDATAKVSVQPSNSLTSADVPNTQRPEATTPNITCIVLNLKYLTLLSLWNNKFFQVVYLCSVCLTLSAHMNT